MRICKECGSYVHEDRCAIGKKMADRSLFAMLVTAVIGLALLCLAACTSGAAPASKYAAAPPDLDVVCLNGVQYYHRDSYGYYVLTPKYSPGFRYPDTCR